MIDLNKLEELARAARDNDMRGESSLTVEFMAFVDELTPAVAIDLIALIRKQEAELASARAESANSGTFLGAAVTVDTPKFWNLLNAWSGKYHSSQPMVRNGHEAAYDTMIAHIDAHVAQEVARALEGQAARVLHLTHERDIALRAARAPSVQPGDGELPALPYTFPIGEDGEYEIRNAEGKKVGEILFYADAWIIHQTIRAARQPTAVGELNKTGGA